MKKFKFLSASAASALGLAAAPEVEEETVDGPEGTGAEQGGEESPSEQQGAETFTFAQMQEAVSAARGEATSSERARTKKVFASPEGQANPSDAAFFLTTGSASADEIITHLKGRAASSSEPKGSEQPQGSISETEVDLGDGTDPSNSIDGSVEDQPEDLWAESAARVHGSSAGFPVTTPVVTAPQQQQGNITTRTGF